jgi:beta-galactosidase
MSRVNLYVLIAVLFLIFQQLGLAEVKLPAIVSSNMVLQRNTKVAIWGWADAGERITLKVSWMKDTKALVADKDGNWRTDILTTDSRQPQTIKIKSKTSDITIENILFGEVWLCSGQSNMQQPLRGFEGQPTFGSDMAIAKSKNPNLRLFTVERIGSKSPLKDLQKFIPWQEASPESANGFSAVAYFFGQQLQEILDVPVGLIHTSWGSSPVQAWMSSEVLSGYQEVDLDTVDITKRPNLTPTALFNAMLYPLIPYTIKGALWYQGEANRKQPENYKNLLPAMVSDWRSRWGIGDFPFYFVQIAPFTYGNNNFTYALDNTAFMREAQMHCVDLIPNSGIAVTTDLGDPSSIHPPKKKEVADRLLFNALNQTYGIKSINYAAPEYHTFQIKDSFIVINFKKIGLGLYAYGKLDGFEIAGEDRIFHPAAARIVNNKNLQVRSEKVPKPLAVRYAWRNFVNGTLFGANLLPVSSFRTDEWKDTLQTRERLSFNEGWLFEKTDDAKASHFNFDDKDWRKLSLPHDWAIEGPFKPEYNPRTGGLPVFGKAWYRKHFTVDSTKNKSIITVEFDGVMSNSTLYINGKKIYERPYGYIGFEVDITPHLNFGGENIIAVEVNPEILSSRWYPGAGIYRNVWMDVKNPVHIAHWGTYITTPEITEDQAVVNIETQLINKGDDSNSRFKLKTTILDAEGMEVSSQSSDIYFKGENQYVTQQILKIANPNLWDLKTPYLYKAVTEVYKENVLIDNYTTNFGVRTIKFTREGFFLNGRQEKINGVCLHHDLGALGTAVNYRATERQLEIMKEMGVNAIRTSHNPTSPEQIDLCNRMGILVQEEAFDNWKIPKVENGYNKYWDEWHEQDLRDMIRRDRNHPSIIMWSIGNEIREQRDTNGYIIARQLTKICHELDPGRPVTAGFNNFDEAIKNGLAKEIDLVGANYKPTRYASTLNSYKDWIVYGAETASTVSSRSVYHLPLKKYDKHESLQVNSYDINSPNWAYPPDIEFHFQDSVSGVFGEFVWTGFDYLGEPTPYGGRDNLTHGNWDVDWPSRSSYFGAVDLAGFPKDRFYLYQSRWTSKPMVHILPHWNWEGTNIEEIPVYCYTNGDEAELFINGKSQGKKVKGIDKTRIPVNFGAWGNRPKYYDSPYRLNWNVPYEPGEIEVVAYKDKKEIARKKIQTAKDPYKIALTADRGVISADGEDLSFITIKIEDMDGIFCPLADNKVDFKVTGPATIAAVDNGNAASIEPFQASYRKAFNGLCLLVIKSNKGEKGEVTIEATSAGLQSKTIIIKSN